MPTALHYGATMTNAAAAAAARTPSLLLGDGMAYMVASLVSINEVNLR